MSKNTPLISVKEYLEKAGFILNSTEDFYRISGIYNYSHIGVLLKKNIQNAWEDFFVISKKDSFFIEGSILTSKAIWEASGHIQNFNDFLIDCKVCKKRFRSDHLQIDEKGLKVCANCGSTDLTDEKPFNLIFKTDENYYLRPETAQLIFSNFKNILNSFHPKIPFCICQIGKAFRNEVTTSNFIFRTKEFEQMECEWFLKPDSWEICFNKCLKEMNFFLTEVLGIKKNLIRNIQVKKEDLAHYSAKNTDIEFLFEHGWSELWGLAYRTNYDLSSHQKYLEKDFEVLYQEKNIKYIPDVVEHSVGLNRLFYALITSCFSTEEDDAKNTREILKIKYYLAPYKFSILPLTKNEFALAEKIFKIFLSYKVSASFFEKGSIGKRYRKNDFLGTPYCVTVDMESIKFSSENLSFTIRDRDTKNQKRIYLSDLIKNEFKIQWIKENFSNTSGN